MTDNVAVVSAADAKFFDLLQGMIRSLRDKPQGRDLSLYVFDLGLTEAQRRWLLVQGAVLRDPESRKGSEGFPPNLRAFLSSCRLPDVFPGHEVYLWIDADAWVQQWQAIDAFIRGALETGFAIVPETDPAYDAAMVEAAQQRSFAMFGIPSLAGLRAGPLNSGIFAGRADAPHWQPWQRLIAANLDRTNEPYLLFLLGQTALTLACTESGLPTAVLPTVCNWLCHFAAPMVSQHGGVLVRPLPPHEPLGIVHQAGNTKRVFVPLRRVGGGAVSRPLSYQAHSQLPADDYVSPGLNVIIPDQCFPHMVRGDQSASEWPYLRRGLPHRWLVDRRIPQWGFMNRDEAHILYNLALRFNGRPALEIGCLMGWSACHLAAAGLDVEVVDPLLGNPAVAASVQQSLQLCRPPGRVVLIARGSPDAVHQLGSQRPGGWSLFVIDGNHEGDAPLIDVKACEQYAAADCAMVLHDLASPDVTNAVAYLKSRGWNIRVYHTAQIMAVAWRGAVDPPAHRPDPRVDWDIPAHLMPLLA